MLSDTRCLCCSVACCWGIRVELAEVAASLAASLAASSAGSTVSDMMLVHQCVLTSSHGASRRAEHQVKYTLLNSTDAVGCSA